MAIHDTSIGTRIADADSVNISIAGHTVPLLFGETKTIGYPIWVSSPLLTLADGTRSLKFAMAFGRRGPLTSSVQLQKVWIDGVLAYSNDPADATSGQLDFDFYDGSEKQTASSTIVSFEGDEKTPAFRDRIYIVIRDLVVPLGGSFPVVQAQILQVASSSADRYLSPFLGDGSAGDVLFYLKDKGYLVTASISPNTLLVLETFDINLRQQISITQCKQIPPGAPVSGVCLSRTGKYIFAAYGNNDFSHSQVNVWDIVAGGDPAVIVGNRTTGPFRYYNDAACAPATNTADEWWVGASVQGTVDFMRMAYQRSSTGINKPQGAYFNSMSLGFSSTDGPKQVMCAEVEAFSTGNDYVLAYVINKTYVAQVIQVDGDVGATANLFNGSNATVTAADGSTVTAPAQVRCFVSSRVDLVWSITPQLDPTTYSTEYISALWISPDSTYIVVITAGTLADGSTLFSRYWKLKTIISKKDNPSEIPAGTSTSDLGANFAENAVLIIDKDSPVVIPPYTTVQSYQQNAIRQIPSGQSKLCYAPNLQNFVVVDLRDGSFVTHTNGHAYDAVDPSIDYGDLSQVVTNLSVYDSDQDIFFYGGLVQLPPNAKPGYLTVYDSAGSSGTLDIATLLQSLGLLAGFNPSVISTHNIDASVVGAVINDAVNFTDIAANICKLFCIDIVETEGKIKFLGPSAGAVTPVRILTEADLATVDQTSTDDGALLTKDRVQSTLLPSSLEVDYLDSDNDFNEGAQIARRIQFPYKTSAGLQASAIGVPIGMSAGSALYWAEYSLFTTWAQALNITGLLQPKHIDLEPGDIIQLNTTNYGSYTLKLTDVYLNADWSVSFTAQSIVLEVPTTLTKNPLTIPAAADPGGKAGVKIAVVDNISVLAYNPLTDDAIAPDVTFVPNIVGITVRYFNTPQSYQPFQLKAPAAWGVITNDHLPLDYWMGIDDTNVITVAMDDQQFPTQVDDATFLAGGNAALIGVLGRWELIYYRDAVYDSTKKVWTISHILRGNHGSDDVMRLGIKGDSFVALRFAQPVALKVPYQSDKMLREYQGIVASQRFKKVADGQFVPTGGSLQPFSPVHIMGVLSGGNVTFSWTRRDRLASDLHDGDDNTPMSEYTEAYDLEILGTDGATVVRTVPGITAPTYLYHSSDIAIDGLAGLTSISVNVYQLSTSVGRGHKGSAVCQLT